MGYQGIAIAGRLGSGKNWLADQLAVKMLGRAAQIGIGDSVKAYAIEHGMIPGGVIDKARDRPVLQKLGARPPHPGIWQDMTMKRCRAAVAEGMIPIVTDVRTRKDETMVRVLGYPIIMVFAPREVRIERVTSRDGVALKDVLKHIDHAATEASVDELGYDFIFHNYDKRHENELARLVVFLNSIR